MKCIPSDGTVQTKKLLTSGDARKKTFIKEGARNLRFPDMNETHMLCKVGA
jgi:hypothetical protein